MAVSIKRRPSNYSFNPNNPNDTAASAIGSPGGAAFIQSSSPHTLSNGVVVYLKTPIENYNGFFWVYVQTASLFSIQSMDAPFDGTGAANIGYINTSLGGVTWYGCNGPYGWNCAHLPIVYRLSNTFWPINSEDTERDITNVTDSNGYCNITTSGDIKNTGSAALFEYVKITGCTDDDLNGVKQIIVYSSDSSFVLDIPYSADADTDLTNNATIQYYYNNYCVKVQVWGGLNNGHEFYSQKPYELLATLELIPDENNICKFSIHEILKKHIEIENNLLLGSLPNNLDAFTMFFIKYGEEYDDSDGTTLGRSTVSYSSDLSTFEGKASNSILDFKNIHSGAMSKYILGTSTLGLFLTNFEIPVIFSGQFFDIGFLWDGVRDIILKKQWYNSSNVLQLTEYSNPVNAFYTGVYRAEVEENCTYPRLDITAYPIDTVNFPAPSSWTTHTVPFTSRTATQFITTGAGSTKNAYTPRVGVTTGDKIKFTITTNIDIATPGTSSIQIVLFDSLISTPTSNTQTITVPAAAGTNTFDVELTAISNNTAVLFINATLNSGGAGSTLTITVPSLYYLLDLDTPISETKTLDIDCTCLPEKATGFNMSWQNNLGHFDYWYFMAYADHIIDITESEEGEENTFPEWPNSYGEFADTSNRKQTSRVSRKQAVIRAENVTLDQLQAIQFIKTSPLVQIVNSIYDRRTVIVDSESFTVYREGQTDAYSITVTITYTDDLPSQKV